VDLSILRAVPYVVARVMGKWLVAFSVAGLRLAASNFNIVIDGDRKSAKYASRDGDRNTVVNLLFNYCGDQAQAKAMVRKLPTCHLQPLRDGFCELGEAHETL
jgi:hypothetical protein